jgi:hypothetical protein
MLQCNCKHDINAPINSAAPNSPTNTLTTQHIAGADGVDAMA